MLNTKPTPGALGRHAKQHVSVRVALITRDQTLTRYCTEILAELPGSQWVLTVESEPQFGSPQDLWIWDFIPGQTMSRNGLNGHLSRCFFVAQRQHLQALREFVGASDLHILLRPVTAATLRAFLSDAGQFQTGANGNHASRLGTLRLERDDMLQYLMQANLKLQEYDQERTNFLARAIHDFRAPLTTIAGYCGLLLEEQGGAITAVQRQMLERMQHSAQRLSRSASAMLQLSVGHRIEQTPSLQVGDIRDCVDQALHELTPFIENKRLAVTVAIDSSPEQLLFEPARIEEMLINLLDNACKFTPRGGAIDLKGYSSFWDRRIRKGVGVGPLAERRSKQVEAPNCFRVDVHDSGPEIPDIRLHRIFEEYTTYAGGQDRSGCGLGLAICKWIARQHEGRIWAENTSTGPVFSFVLPFRRNETGLAAGATSTSPGVV